jgi:hypothetical protein
MLFLIQLKEHIIIDTLLGATINQDSIIFNCLINKTLIFKENKEEELIVKYSDSEFYKVESIKIKNEFISFFNNKAKDLQKLKTICSKIV